MAGLKYDASEVVTGGRVGPSDLENMSTKTADETEGTVVENGETRFAELNIGDEEFVIYDRENHRAWIQSTVAYGLEEFR